MTTQRHPDKPFGMVAWDDAVGYSDDIEESDVPHAPLRYQTYGWILRSDAAGVTIASEWRPDGKYRDRSFIPRGMVVEERTYALTQPRKRRARRALVPAVQLPG